MSDAFMSAFFATNSNSTDQSQYNPTDISHVGGDVHVTNVQSNATSQDISGLGLDLGGGHGHGGEMFGFEGDNSNATSQSQYNPTDISHVHGSVSVENFQGNATDQSVHGTGVNVHDLGLGHDFGGIPL